MSFSPGKCVVMRTLYCSTTPADPFIMIASGTLSPLETTIKELGIEFPVRLENSHVIDANQVWVGVVGTGVTGKKLNSSYATRSTDEYQLELGNTIVNFTRLVPKGLLVFFPSYRRRIEGFNLGPDPPAKASVRGATRAVGLQSGRRRISRGDHRQPEWCCVLCCLPWKGGEHSMKIFVCFLAWSAPNSRVFVSGQRRH